MDISELDRYVAVGNLEINMRDHIAHYCYHQGECIYDCERWVSDPFIQEQFSAISDKDLADALDEYFEDAREDGGNHGEWRRMGEIRLLWLAAAEYIESIEEY